ncbi:MAG: helix-turn-helix domain-containing protein [Gemmatimonas sp.]
MSIDKSHRFPTYTTIVPRSTERGAAAVQTVLHKSARVVTPESVTTLLSPAERARVDAAGEGCFVSLHRESVDEVLNDLRQRRASAVLVSVSHYVSQQTPPVARLVREFPRVPAVALLTGSESSSSQAVLSLGQQGVRALVDVRDAHGWRELRRLITEERSETVERMAVLQLHRDLAGAPEDCLRFFDTLFTSPMAVCTVRQLARRLGVLPSTLMSRFFRAEIPAPKSYLAMARLVRAARLFENPGLSVAQVATQLEYSSPQSFSRHVLTILQVTAVAFRRKYDGETMFEHMRNVLVLPHRAALIAFHPLVVAPGWMGRDTPL